MKSFGLGFIFTSFIINPFGALAATCTSPAGTTGQTTWVSSLSSVGYCDGAGTWISMTVSPTATACSVQGEVTYRTDELQFCNGTNWIGASGTTTGTSCAGTASGTMTYDVGADYIKWCDGTTWKTTRSANKGFFVYSGSFIYNGNLGGLSGANATCLSLLQTYNFKDKASAQIDSSRVFAFLCDSTTCNNLLPSTKYFFAQVNDTVGGGASFTTNASGQGPNDSTNNWASSTFFNASSNYFYYSGRLSSSSSLWATTPDTSFNCSGFTSNSSGFIGRAGNVNSTNNARWTSGNQPTCNLNRALICYVNP